MRVRLTQIDGSLPNLALMKLSYWHKAQGHEVTFTRQAHRDLLEGEYDRVYASSIFEFSRAKTQRLIDDWPGAIVGGTGTSSPLTVESIIGPQLHEAFDYDLYPEFEPSIGFTQRGCRLSCKFCVVPKKEGKNRSNSAIYDLWRGPGHARKLHLLDNDFFGQPEEAWRTAIADIQRGEFKVCLTQGINVRLITPEAAEGLASIEYRDGKFRDRRLYTAWDNLKDEQIFFAGVTMLEAAGIPAGHIYVYMLVGYDKNETWDRIWHRFNRMLERGVFPYPMVFDCRAKDPERYRELKRFQRWVLTGLYRAVPFGDYDAGKKAQATAEWQPDLFGRNS